MLITGRSPARATYTIANGEPARCELARVPSSGVSSATSSRHAVGDLLAGERLGKRLQRRRPPERRCRFIYQRPSKNPFMFSS